MRSLTEFLTESKKNYEYRIKIAGDCPKEHVDALKKLFAKFNMVSMSDMKTTPVTKCPYDFPGLENESVNIFDVVFEYPASTGQLAELMQKLGIAENRVVILDRRFNDSMDAEVAAKEHEGALLDDAELPAQTADQKAAGAAYGNSFQDVVADMEKREYEISGGKTPKAQTTNDLPQGTKSPVGS